MRNWRKRATALGLALCLLAGTMIDIETKGAWRVALAQEGEGEPAGSVEPTVEPTKEAETEATPEPTLKPTPEIPAEPTPEETATPGATATPEATEPPLNLLSEPGEGEPTQEPAQEPTAEPTPEVTDTPEITATPEPTQTQEPTQEPAQTPTQTPTPEASATPEVAGMPEATAAPEVTSTPEASATPLPSPLAALSAAAEAGMRYAFANEDSLNFKVKIAGGAGPYQLIYEILLDGNSVCRDEKQIEKGLTEEYQENVVYMPTEFGVHTLKITVTDATGARTEAQCAVPVAVREVETRAAWEKSVRGASLTGNWAEDIVAIAKTQVGYTESERNFIIDEEGNMQGYTRYGDWYGGNYREWCAMFVSFCAHYAGIPEETLPREGRSADLKEKLGQYYIDDEESYAPRAGDLIFFNHEGKNRPQHIGIVTDVRGGTVYTIEGNSGRAVREREYSLDDSEIVGYMDMAAAMLDAGVIEAEAEPDAAQDPEPTLAPENEGAPTPEPTQTPENEGGSTANNSVAGREARTNAGQVNLRAEPGTEAERIAQVEEGTELRLIEAVLVDGETWYKADYNGRTIYVRSDLVTIELLTENLQPMETVCNCGTETDEHAEDCPLYVAPVCNCEAVADENGNVVHGEECPLYVAPACNCGAVADEDGNIVHGEDCPLYAAPECNCGTETDEHAEDCPLYVAPVCSCGTETDEHAEDCPLYEAPVCTCGAEADENGNIAHSEDCPLYEAPACTCGAEMDENGNIIHAGDCPLYEAAPLSEAARAFVAAVDDLPMEEILAAARGYMDAVSAILLYEEETPAEAWDEEAYAGLGATAEQAYMSLEEAIAPAMAAQEMRAALTEGDLSDARVAEAALKLDEFALALQAILELATLPGNNTADKLDGDWIYLSKFEVSQIQDGTGPFDLSDDPSAEDYKLRPGNDENDSNLRVRSFDTIHYAIDYATASSGEYGYVREGWLNFEFVLPATSDKAVFLPGGMAWIGVDRGDAAGLASLQEQTSGYYVTTETRNGVECQVLRGKYWLAPNNDNPYAMPGEGSLTAAVQVKAMKEGETVQPTFSAWMEHNETEGTCETHGRNEVVSDTADAVTVTSQVRMNIEIAQKTSGEVSTLNGFDFSSGDAGALNKDAGTVVGQQLRYGIMVQLRNENSADGMKGMEIPDGDTLTFDINLNSTYTPSGGRATYLTDTDYNALAWVLGENENVPETWHGRDPLPNSSGTTEYRTNTAPANQSATDDRACLDGGDWSVAQNGSTYTVTVSNFQVDFDQIPANNLAYAGAYEANGIAVISAGQLVVVQPVTVEGVNIWNAEGIGNGGSGQIQTIVTDSNLEFSYQNVSGGPETVTNDDQTVKTDDRVGSNLTVGASGGTYDPTGIWTQKPEANFVGWGNGIYDAQGIKTTAYLNKGGDPTAAGRDVGILMCMDHTNGTQGDGSEIVAAKFLAKFDATGATPTGQVEFRNHAAAKGYIYNILYATKPDGSHWADDDEMKRTSMTELVYYSSLDAIPEGQVCVAILAECLPENANLSGINTSRQLPGFNAGLTVNDDAEGGGLYLCAPEIVYWSRLDYEGLEGNIPSLANNNPNNPTALINTTYHHLPTNYNKGYIDSDGVLMGNTGDHKYGDAIRIMTAKSHITKEVAQQDNNHPKSVFYLDSDQRVVDYKLNVSTSPAVSGTTLEMVVDVTVTDTLDAGLTYIPGSLYYGGTYAEASRPGRQGTVTGGVQIAPDVIRKNADGTTDIVFTIKDVKVGDALETIYLSAEIGTRGVEATDVVNNQILDNIAVSRCSHEPSPTGANPDNKAQTSITVSKIGATSRSKLPEKTYVEAGEPYRWTINIGNNGGTTMENVVAVDTLPYVGDDAGSSFTGNLKVTGWDVATTLSNIADWKVFYTEDEAVRTAVGNFAAADILAGTANGIAFTDATGYFDSTTGKLTLPSGISPTALVMVGDLPGNNTLKINVEFQLDNPQPGDVLANQLDGYPTRVYTVKRSLQGVTWIDDDIDGARQSDELMLSGVKVALLKLKEGGDPTNEADYGPCLDANGKPMTVETGYQLDRESGAPVAYERGEYRFTGLDPGTYAVKFTSGSASLSDYAATPANRGDDDTVDSDGIPAYDAENVLQSTLILGIVMESANSQMSDVEQVSAHHDSGFYQLPPMSVTVKKEVTGSMGDRSRAFAFKITFTDERGDPLPEGTEMKATGGTLAGVAVSAPTDTILTLDENGSATFSLMHGQTYQITGMAGTDKVRVIETGMDGMGYTTTIADSGRTGTLSGTDTGVCSLRPSVRDRAFTYTNAREGSVPTGILLDIWPFALTTLLALGGLMMLAASRKRRRMGGGRDA